MGMVDIKTVVLKTHSKQNKMRKQTKPMGEKHPQDLQII
jgi:hypothetical protein